MKILITGASGFIGSSLVDAALHEGFDVSVMVRESSSKRFLKGKSVTTRTADLVGDDVQSLESLERAVAGIDVVIHLAGVTEAKSRKHFFEVNAEGTRRLAHAALAAGVKKFIYVSSLAAFGPGASLNPIVETDEPRPVSWYGESKLRGELFLEELRGKLPYVILRPAIVYGPRDKNMMIFFKLISRQILPKFVGNTPTGQKYYSVVYVDDVVKAILSTCRTSQGVFEQGEGYFLSDGEIYTGQRLFGAIAHGFGVRAVEVPMLRPVTHAVATLGSWVTRIVGKTLPFSLDKWKELDADYWICSIEKAGRDLGYRPAVLWEEGVARVIESMKRDED